MRRHLVYTVIMLTLLILLFGNLSYAGDRQFVYTERGKFTIKCFEEKGTDLFCFKRPIDSSEKKPVKEPFGLKRVKTVKRF